MALDDILDLAEKQLAKEGLAVPKGHFDAYREHRVLPETVLERRSIGADDDLASALVLADQVELEELRRRVGKSAGSILRHPRHLLEAWGVCEALRRLGFTPDQMSVGWGDVVGQGDDVVYVRINAGNVSMTVCVARIGALSAEEALQGWDKLWEDVTLAGEDDLSIALARSSMGDYRRLVMLVAEISRQGIKLPGMRMNQEPITMLAGPLVRLTPGGES
jgi:hypothetical protein